MTKDWKTNTFEHGKYWEKERKRNVWAKMKRDIVKDFGKNVAKSMEIVENLCETNKNSKSKQNRKAQKNKRKNSAKNNP